VLVAEGRYVTEGGIGFAKVTPLDVDQGAIKADR
jgi:hypothetical protein